MDLSLLAHLAPTLFWLLPLAFAIGLLKSPWIKGYLGELLVRLFAHWRLGKQTYRRLHNVTLPTPDGTTQIDHVSLSRYGIFVVETKNLSGWIFGSERQAQWTQKLYRRTFKFQNPLRQNYKHLKALEAALGINPEHLHSVITFVGGSTFKTEVPAKVTQGIGFIRYIKSFQQPLFSEAEVDAMLQTLQTGRRALTLATQRKHVEAIKFRRDPTGKRQVREYSRAMLTRAMKPEPKIEEHRGCAAFPNCWNMQNL